MIVKFKSDEYRKTRGGYSRFYDILCEHCGAKILTYQKDGPGILKRLYLDRISAPENLANFQKLSINRIPNLVCQECRTVLAVPYIYKKEDRKAYRLFVGAVSKKITKI